MSKIALITGANKGIGLETARQLAREHGFTVLLGARDPKRGTDAMNQLRNEGLDAHFLHLDPTDAASIGAAVLLVRADYGVLDLLVNNAGILLEADFAPPAQIPVFVLRDTFEVNVFAVHAVTQAFWPLLEQSSAARLVNVSSWIGSLSLHSDGAFGDYKPIALSSSKAALNMMTVHYAWQWRDSPHRANAAHPGNVLTPGNPHGEISVEEGAKTSVELATIGANGPNGTFSHLGKPLPW